MNYSADIEAAARIAAAAPRGATYGDILAEARKARPGIALVTVQRWARYNTSACGMVLVECRTAACDDAERKRVFLTKEQAYSSGINIAYIVGSTHVGRRDELLQAIGKTGSINAQGAADALGCCVEYAQRHLALAASQGLIACNGRLGAERRWYIGAVPEGETLVPLRDVLPALAARPEGVGFDVAPWGRSVVAKVLSQLFRDGVMVRRRTKGESRYFIRADHADAWKLSRILHRPKGIKAERQRREAACCNSIAKSITKDRGVGRPKTRLPMAVESITPENVKRTVCPSVMGSRFDVKPSEVSGVFGALGPGQYLNGREDSPFTAYLKGL